MNVAVAPPSPSPAPRPTRSRTCVTCGKSGLPEQLDSRDQLAELVRLVLAPSVGEREDGAIDVAVDAAGGSFGRGAYVHASPACLERAERGLSRSFRRPISAPAAALGAAIVAALHRRAVGLLASAHRLRRVELGTDVVKAALAQGAPGLLIVARDAGSVATSHEVSFAIGAGRAVAFATRSELGALFGRDEVALALLTEAKLASTLASVVRASTSLSSLEPALANQSGDQPQKPKGEACKSPEVR